MAAVPAASGGFSSFMGSAGGQAAIQGGLSVGGNLFSAREGKKAYKRQVKLYRENRDWEERMSNTAWQRGVTDMLAAGINPMVAFNQGGASTPTSSAPDVSRPIQSASGAFSAASKAANLLALKQMEANINLTNANAYKSTQEGTTAAEIARNAPAKANYEMNEVRQRVEQLIEQGELTRVQAEQIKKLLPLMMRVEESRAGLQEAQTTSARQASALDKLKMPEAEVNAKWFESMLGGGGKLTNAMKDILQIIQMLRSGK